MKLFIPFNPSHLVGKVITISIIVIIAFILWVADCVKNVFGRRMNDV